MALHVLETCNIMNFCDWFKCFYWKNNDEIKIRYGKEKYKGKDKLYFQIKNWSFNLHLITFHWLNFYWEVITLCPFEIQDVLLIYLTYTIQSYHIKNYKIPIAIGKKNDSMLQGI